MYIIDLENLTVSSANVCSVNVCGIGTCGKPVECNGYCNKHYKRTDYEIGYNQPIEGQKYYPTTNGHGKKTKCSTEWCNMMQRCYKLEYKERKSSYIGVYSTPEWLNFQAFASWCEKEYYEIPGQTMCLDKDLFANDNSCIIFVKDNNMKYKNGGYYSPETCCFLPERLNNLLRTKSQELDSDNIEGIYLMPNGKYRVTLCNKYLGTFDDKRSAWLCYKRNKELIIQTRTEEYKEYLPKHIYDKLMEYEIEDYENNTWATFNECFRVDENETKKQGSDSDNPNND